jgi:hypothetical protein
MQNAPADALLSNRNKLVAKSFFRHLKNEGFTHEQIIALSTELLDLVAADMREVRAGAAIAR